MAVGSSLIQGYNAASQGQRSLMPAINTLGNVIRDRRKVSGRRGSRVSFSRGGSSGSDARAADRENRHQTDKARDEEKYRYEMERSAEEKKRVQDQEMIASEEARSQEKHDSSMRRSEMESERGAVTAGREDKTYQRNEAYENAKMGIMMKDPSMIQQALQDLMPEGNDTITHGKTEGGARKVTARPGKRDVPIFIFHPDGYIGVTFPGQDKPTVFENQDEVFKNVLAPMNPDRWTDKPGTAKDRVTSDKNVREAEYNDKKLQADVHSDAHEAAMKQFEADGYYQPALYNEKKYQTAYDSYVQRATGTVPEPPVGKGTRTGTPGQYKGDEAPKGFPGARQGPRGGWYVQKKGKWYPILEGKEESPAVQGSPPGFPKLPSRSPMQPRTAENEPEIQASGVNIPARRGGSGSRSKPKDSKRKGKVYTGKAQPPEYPDAHWNEKDNAWYYFESEKQIWEKVRI